MSAAATISGRFDSAAVEKKWRAVWEAGGFFDSAPRAGRENYCIMLPPPNVTGALHMGHAFQHSLMDALARRERMRGRNVLWQPGTDHAGIAAQIVVTRELAAQNIDASSLSREEFLRRAWEWKARAGGEITAQMRRLGASCDWSRERFTMDDGLSATVTDVFVRLYEEGLIYRGKRMVNWDPVMRTAVSDLEVVAEEEDGAMYYVRYPFVGGADGGVVIGTTRPETILADGAIAVHPDDARHRGLLGKKVWVPLTEPPRAIEIIADSYVDPEFGSGCVKITAAHDFNDYEVYKRHPDKNIPVVVLLSADAKMTDAAPRAYRGLDRHAARERIAQDLAAAGLLVDKKPHRYKLPRGDRSGAVVEPMLTDQWFMKMKAPAARAAARSAAGEPRFVPAQWRKTYDQWLRDIQDWCLSRQLRWGHRIPAWYDEDGGVYVARDENEARRKAGGKKLRRDEDVLDTWFSSSLWPFSTLDWPRADNDHFRAYFPSSVLVTGFDIIFFWVARMTMMSGHLTGETPFHDVHITGLVRDGAGQKMSKSRGNVLDPLDLTDGIDAESLVKKRVAGLMDSRRADAVAAASRAQFPDGIPSFGADALRFTFASLASHGRDIKFDLSRCAGHRNFCNKIWNAARFVLHSCGDYDADADAAPPSAADLWIVGRLRRACAETSAAFDDYRFDLAAATLHRFLWREYCDWYLELAKIALRASPPVRARAQRTLICVMETSLRLLHPLMPFITEELWEKIAPLAGKSAPSLSREPWPRADELQAADAKYQEKAEEQMRLLTEAVDACRRLREESATPPAARPILLVRDDANQFSRIGDAVAALCGFSEWEKRGQLPPGSLQMTGASCYFALDSRAADKTAARARLSQKLRKTEDELASVDKILANESFVARAPADIVGKKRARRESLQNAARDLQHQLRDLEGE